MPENNIALSIIIPTYNRGSRIKATIDSLLLQDLKNYEVIVVDDGSTDNTEEILQRFYHDDIRYIKIPNSERGAARNHGCQMALGSYVNFFDSDDIAYKHHTAVFEKLKDDLNEPEVFAVSYDLKDDQGRHNRTISLNRPVSEFIMQGNDLSCNGVFIRKDIALQHSFTENRALSASEDYELWLRLAARFKFPTSSKRTHAVIVHSGRSTLNFDPTPLIERKLLMLELALKDPKVRERLGDRSNELKGSTYSYIALHIAMSGSKKRLAFHWFAKSIVVNPSSLLSRRSLAIMKHLILS